LEALQRRDHGETDGSTLAQQVRDAVDDVVRLQAQAGVSVVNDGEAGKIGYSTYVKERLDGFGGEGGLARMPADLVEFPGYMQRVMGGLRLVRYAKLVGRENVIAGSDCGFATFASFLAIDPGITWAKLHAMADGARLASAQLW
jgi:methionine synthase II (cobalamin-independent)